MIHAEKIYWGILCRTCSELVAFGATNHLAFEMERTYAKPGAIRCPNGHNHIYFPRDFRFLPSQAAIPDEVMRANREEHRAINCLAHGPSEDQDDQLILDEEELAGDAPPEWARTKVS